MRRLINSITAFLEDSGFECSRQVIGGNSFICTRTLDGVHERTILPLEIAATSESEACRISDEVSECLMNLEGYPLIITEDRWHAQPEMTRARLLAHLEVHDQAFARNCVVRRIEKAEARDFLIRNHSYGDAACKYRYGLFLMRQTGHLAGRFPIESGMTTAAGTAGSGMTMAMGKNGAATAECGHGMLVAVATFSNARKWLKGGREIRSYEWTRYASLPGLRVSGGMGKMLKAFINEVHPDDIMSYADLEWSEGTVYGKLGFTLEGRKDPVLFSVDPGSWRRSPVKPGMTAVPARDVIARDVVAEDVIAGDVVAEDVIARDVVAEDVIAGSTGNLYFRNFGSNKYRLKLTDYE